MDTLTSLRVFCEIAELKSFTAAANRLGLSPAMASKHVMHLESRVGSRLLNRTSRRVSLTEPGALYLAQARRMLDDLDEVEAAIGTRDSRAARHPAAERAGLGREQRFRGVSEGL